MEHAQTMTMPNTTAPEGSWRSPGQPWERLCCAQSFPCRRSIGSGAGCSACTAGGVSARGGGYSRTTREPAGSERDAAA